MSDAFLTITQATTLTGKSRRTLLRFAEQLQKDAPTQVMRERTAKGYIWRIHEQQVRQRFGVTKQTPRTPVHEQQPPAPSVPLAALPEKYIEITQQGYLSVMAMHQEVKMTYEALLREKDLRIQELTKALEKGQQGFWGRLFSHN